MRFSTTQAAAGLLALGSLLSIVNSAPTGLLEYKSPLDNLHGHVKRIDIPVPHEEPHPEPAPAPRPAPPPPAGGAAGPKVVPAPVLKTYPPKPVPNPFDTTKYGYTSKDAGTDPTWGAKTQVFTQDYKDGKSSVDLIAINTDKNSISVLEAFNKCDRPADSTKKLSLPDFEMSLFTKAGKKPQDLALIHLDHVEEKDTLTAIKSIWLAGKKRSTDLGTVTVKSFAATGSTELNGFNTLYGTPFGRNADKVRQQFSVGKPITGFTITAHPGTIAKKGGKRATPAWVGQVLAHANKK